MHFLADVYGPRLTGSPNHKAAAEWAVKQMTSWGILERASRAVGVRSSRLGQRARRGPHRLADEERAGRAAARLDAGHQGQRDRQCVQPRRSRRARRADAAAARGRRTRRRRRLGPTQAELTAYSRQHQGRRSPARRCSSASRRSSPVNFNAEATRLTDLDARCRYSPTTPRPILNAQRPGRTRRARRRGRRGAGRGAIA